MIQQNNRGQILDTAPKASDNQFKEHITGFVNSFVEKNRRERWLDLLLHQSKQLYSNSHKLYNHLDKDRYCLLTSAKNLDQQSIGIYFNFLDPPVILSVRDAFIVSIGIDAIFSLKPGKLAIYFFHENESFLCKI